MYQITNYSYLKAKELGVDIYPSNRKNKKIDVYKADQDVTVDFKLPLGNILSFLLSCIGKQSASIP